MTIFVPHTASTLLSILASRINWEYVAHKSNDPQNVLHEIKSIEIVENPRLKGCYMCARLRDNGSLLIEAREYEMFSTLACFDLVLSGDEMEITINQDSGDSTNIDLILGRRVYDHDQTESHGFSVS